MLVDKFICMRRCLIDHLFRFSLSVVKDRILIGDDPLIMSDLIRSLRAKLLKKGIHFVLVYDNICFGKSLISAGINKILNLVNHLLDFAAHLFRSSLFILVKFRMKNSHLADHFLFDRRRNAQADVAAE